MSFENWFAKHANSVWRALPWLKDDLKDAYMAGRKSVRKPRSVAIITHPVQSVDVAAIREVIGDLREWGGTDEQLAKRAEWLTAALQEKGNG